MSLENKKEIEESVRAAGTDENELRERIRGLVMKALVDHQADPAAIRDVMRDTVAGGGAGPRALRHAGPPPKNVSGAAWSRTRLPRQSR